jgi:hypothetical protein
MALSKGEQHGDRGGEGAAEEDAECQQSPVASRHGCPRTCCFG